MSPTQPPAVSTPDAPGPAAVDPKALAYLEALLDVRIVHYYGSTGRFARKAFRNRWIITVAGALITVLLGLRNFAGPAQAFLSNLALLLGALVTALNAWSDFAGHRRLWIEFSTAVSALEAIRRDLRYLKNGGNGGLDRAKLDAIYLMVQKVIGSTDEAWKELREAGDTKPPPPIT